MPRFLFFFLIFFSFSLNAQFTNNIWCFGDSAGVDWTDPQNPSFFTSAIKGRGSCVALADSNSLLLYGQTDYGNQYLNRTRLFNRFHELVPNTDSILGGGWYQELLLLPSMYNDSLAYFFSIMLSSPPFGLYYTVVNYRHNNDSGLVLNKNVMLSQIGATDGIIATKHGNGRDWWIILQEWDPVNMTPNNKFYIFLLTPDGIVSYPVQNVGPLKTTNGTHTVFNSEGNKLSVVNWRGLIAVYDFDRCTGLLSNPITIEPEKSGGPYPYYLSNSFSPNSNVLYVTSAEQYNGYVDSLFQFDLSSSNVSQSKQTIYYLPNNLSGLAMLKLAPDNKIYLASSDESLMIPYPDTFFTAINSNLSVINSPDSLGSASDFQPFSFYLGGNRTYWGLPNNSDFSLGPLVGSPCDTLTSVTEITESATLQSWFHSDWEILFVNASKLKGSNCTVNVFDLSGRLIKTQKGKPYTGYFTADVSLPGLSSGVYIVQLVTERESMSAKFFR